MIKYEKCTFFGHRDFAKIELKDYIEEIFEYLIVNENVVEFLSGGMGNFDRICEGILRKLKVKFPHIKLKLVLPYMEYRTLKLIERDIPLYDELIIPNLGASNFKEALPKRNIYLVDNCKFLISGIYKDEGGSVTAVKYAKSKEDIKVIDILKKENN